MGKVIKILKKKGFVRHLETGKEKMMELMKGILMVMGKLKRMGFVKKKGFLTGREIKTVKPILKG